MLGRENSGSFRPQKRIMRPNHSSRRRRKRNKLTYNVPPIVGGCSALRLLPRHHIVVEGYSTCAAPSRRWPGRCRFSWPVTAKHGAAAGTKMAPGTANSASRTNSCVPPHLGTWTDAVGPLSEGLLACYAPWGTRRAIATNTTHFQPERRPTGQVVRNSYTSGTSCSSTGTQRTI